jgi:hypothetical protein
MKIKYKILLFFLLIPIFGNQILFAQINQTIRAELNIRNVQLTNQNTLKFDLYLLRNTDDWERLANGTFQFELFPDSIPITTVTLDSTDLPPNTDITGGVLPVDGYKQNFQIYPERLSITCLGPQTFNNCIVVPKINGILIGSYTITSPNNLANIIEWKKPLTYYQALAYKIGHDSLFTNGPEHILYDTNDNVPLINGNSDQNSIAFSLDTAKHKFIIKSFTAKYSQEMKIALQFTIIEEYQALGYTILRKPQLYPPSSPFTNDPENIPPDSVFTYKRSSIYFNPIMISQGWDKTNLHTYSGLMDLVQYRGGNYCYQLWATLLTGTGLKDTLIGEDCAGVPALIIAQASATPNPFNDKTIIKYEIVEDAYITAEIWDVVGRKLDAVNLKDEEVGFPLDGSGVKTVGWHELTFQPQKISSQGLFNIVIDAKPKNPLSTIEKGRAIIKVQFLIEKKEGQ